MNILYRKNSYFGSIKIKADNYSLNFAKEKLEKKYDTVKNTIQSIDIIETLVVRESSVVNFDFKYTDYVIVQYAIIPLEYMSTLNVEWLKRLENL